MDGTVHRLPIVEIGPKNNGTKQAYVFHLQEDLMIPEKLCSAAKEGCNDQATATYTDTGRVLCLKAGHDISIIAPMNCRPGDVTPSLGSCR